MPAALGDFDTRMEKAHRETESGSSRARSAGPILAWKVHLLREEPARLLLIAPVVLTSLLACYILFHSLLFLAVTLFLLMSALAEFLFPVCYEVNGKGASSRTLVGRTFITWDRIKKYYVDDRGVKLSPLRKPGRLEAYRGVYLRFGSRRDEVIEAVRRMRDAGANG